MDHHADSGDPFLLLPPTRSPVHPSRRPMSKHSPPSPTSPYLMPAHSYSAPAPMTAGSAKASTSALPMIQFDPKASPSDGEEEDEEDEDAPSTGGRPKKRKSVVNLRAAAKEGGERKGKIQIEYVADKGKRHITFSKRKAGIMKKAYELATLTGTQIMLLVVSESGWVYTFTTDHFKPMVKADEDGNLSEGQQLIARCLEGPPKQSSSTTGESYQGEMDFSNPPTTPTHRRAPSVSSSQPPSSAQRPISTNRRLATKASASQLASLARLQLNIPPVPALPQNVSHPSPHMQYGLTAPSNGLRRRPSQPALVMATQLQMQQHQALMGNLGTGAGGGGGGQDYVDMLNREQAKMAQMGSIYERDVGSYPHDNGLAYLSPPPTSNPINGSGYDQSHFLRQQQESQQHAHQSSAALYAALALPSLDPRNSSLSLSGSLDPDLAQSLYVHEMDEALIGGNTYTTLQDPHSHSLHLNHIPSVLLQPQAQVGRRLSASQVHEMEIQRLLDGTQGMGHESVSGHGMQVYGGIGGSVGTSFG